jgi:cytoskeletal protein CcmA (bactofilin family)
MHLPVTANVKETVSIKGELTVEEDLTVEGCVEGRIELKDHNLWIGPHGKVSAKIHAKSVIVAGEVVGDIQAGELVEIKMSGSVRGDISCPRISIVDGAQFQGRINTEIRGETSKEPDFPKARFVRMSQTASSG